MHQAVQARITGPSFQVGPQAGSSGHQKIVNGLMEAIGVFVRRLVVAVRQFEKLRPSDKGCGGARVRRRHDVIQAACNDQHLFANLDRKSTRLNSSHTVISYAVFCLIKKKYTSSIVSTLAVALLRSTFNADTHKVVTQRESSVLDTPADLPDLMMATDECIISHRAH